MHSSEAAVVLARPWTAMMREYGVENVVDAGTPCIEFAGAQGFHGAIPQTHVRTLAEQRREWCDMSYVLCVGVNACLEADVDLATVVKVNQIGEPIATLIIERSNTRQARQS